MNKKIVLFGLVFMMLLFTGVASAVLPVISNEYPTDDATLWDCPSATINATITDIDGTFNWTIETLPNVGSASGNTASNGSKTCDLTLLNFTATYRWYVNTTDNTSLWTNASYNFTTRDAKLRENPELNIVETAVVGVVGLIILLGFLYIVAKMDMKKEGQLAKLLVGLLVALALLGVIFTLL